VSAGDEFNLGGLPKRNEAEADLQVLSLMGYHAVALGDLEFAHGLDFLTRQIAKYPFLLSSNVVWADSRAPLARTVRYETYRLPAAPGRPARPLRVAILAFLSAKRAPDVQRHLGGDAQRILILGPIAEAKKQVSKARHNAEFVVVLAHMDEEQAKELARQVPGIGLMVMGDMPGRRIVLPIQVGNALMVADSSDGQNVGRLTLALNSAGSIADSRGGEQLLDKEFADDPRVAQVVVKAKKATLAQATSPQGQFGGQGSYAGAISCRACHEREYARWLSTPHAKAHQTLARRGQNNLRKPECQRCHSLGFGEPAGFVSIDATPAKANVQCESCHGPGLGHATAKDPMQRRSTIRRVVLPAVCTACHDKQNDPKFDYVKKLVLVKH
jgi:hypothetical protein